MIEGIVFDLDDTLYPERQYVLSGLSATARWIQGTMGYRVEDVETELLDLHELDPKRVFDRWAAIRQTRDQELVRQLVHVYQTHRPDIDLYRGTRSLLRRLRASYVLGLISDGYLRVQQTKFKALEIEEFFHAIVFSDSIGRDAWKPDPRPYKACLQELELPPNRAVYVADNPTKDFLGARNVGMFAIRINHESGYHYGAVPETNDHGAHLEIGKLGELENALKSLPSTPHVKNRG